MYTQIPILLTIAGTVNGYAWMERIANGGPAATLDKRAPICPIHLAPQGAAPYSDYYPSKYTGAKNGLPGTGKGGVLVPAAGDTAHAYSPPSPSDIRGPCPGSVIFKYALNMAANHNFISHDGLTNFVELVDFAQNVFNWGWDLATFVATFGIVMDGDPFTSQLSIGCGGGMQIPNTGLNAHNKFETDSSMTRNDYFTSPTGDAYSVNATIFGYMNDYCDGDFTLGCMGPYMGSRYNNSKETNPNFFFGPLGLFAFGTATLPQESFASYGNAGTPSVDTIQYFWAVNRSASGSSTWIANPGHETIPPNWCNRPTALSFAEIFGETSQLYAEAGYPAFGGNVGKTDAFVGLTFEAGGIENGILKDPSAEGIACLFQQVLMDTVPQSLSIVLTQDPIASAFAKTNLAGIFKSFGCPAL
ncbi:hypothetical protein E4T38_07712 [Aureobasidium subglaciale]|nr:hypothetical protein E4T38_07712 [Aureobasidium subglaciale]KAI5216875.1 hypothetical protein E4T40_07722 [Aureobasidium subglaciale]KAI5220197.1 hypothetical protein E4T41_07637 [Aureobasidium subglaciale]KAI5258152.1 hypothetical protein E4T46_07613 [Aureobasidium subglaciale]